MEKEKELMTVYNTPEGTGVRVTCDNSTEMFLLCLAITQTIDSYPAMKKVMSFIRYEMDTDPEFKRAIDSASIDTQDFNELLKNL